MSTRIVITLVACSCLPLASRSGAPSWVRSQTFVVASQVQFG